MEKETQTMEGRIFYISDYHFDHEIALNRSRSDCFSSLQEMNEAIIERHNRKVKDTDIVYILGDVIVAEDGKLKEGLERTVGRLNGQLHLIFGNHDYKYRDSALFASYFASVQDSLIIKDEGHWVQLYHYPILNWYRKQKGAYHIYGHLHNEKRGKEIQILKNEERALNACVEITGYEPCSLEELIARNQEFYQDIV